LMSFLSMAMTTSLLTSVALDGGYKLKSTTMLPVNTEENNI